MAVTIISFSPTGGTLKCAEIVAKELADESSLNLIDLTKEEIVSENLQLNENDTTIIALPSYAGRAPEVAIKRLKGIRGNNSNAICISVYGNRESEDTLLEITDTAKLAGFNVIAGIDAIAEHSIARIYATGRPDKADEETLRGFAVKIRNNSNKEPVIPGNRPYKEAKPIPVTPKTTKNCLNCGLCIKACPVGAIDHLTPKKTDHEKCISCMRCVYICPEKAREISALTLKAVEMKLHKTCQKRKEPRLYLNNGVQDV